MKQKSKYSLTDYLSTLAVLAVILAFLLGICAHGQPMVFSGPLTPGGGSGFTTNTFNITGSPVFTNELLVSQGGSDSLGQRGTTNAFASVHAAVKASQNGDIIIVQSGPYNEGTNVAGIPPKNLSIICYGLATLQYTLTNGGPTSAGLNITNIYIHPADNLYMANIYGFTTQSNFFSAFFGTGSTNDTGTATNVTLVNVRDTFCDSDGFIFNGTNRLGITCDRCGTDHYWDGVEIGSTINTNSTFTFKNCDFNCDRFNGSNPSIRTGVNFAGAPAGVNIYFYNSTVSISDTNNSSNIGIRIGPAKLWLNGVGFGVPHNGQEVPPWADLDYVNQLVDGGSVGIIYSTLQTNFQLVVYNSVTTVGFPLNLLGSFLYGPLMVPLTQSSDATDDVGPPYGSWGLGDEGTNGTMSETNIGNLNAVNPSYIEHTPESENQTTPVSGKFALHNMGLQLYGTYDSVAFSDVEPGQVALLVSNVTDIYAVKSSGVIGKIATGSGSASSGVFTVTNMTLSATNKLSTRGQWLVTLQCVDAVGGQPIFRVQLPGILTNSIAPLGFSVSATETNFYNFPVNPNTTNIITDISAGTGASVTSVDSKIVN